MMLHEINIYEHPVEGDELHGKLSLNIAFSDQPLRFFSGQMPIDCDRTQVIEMLRELATQIEYDIAHDEDRAH